MISLRLALALDGRGEAMSKLDGEFQPLFVVWAKEEEIFVFLQRDSMEVGICPGDGD